MERNTRRRTENQKWWEDKKVLLSASVVAVVLVIAIGISIYSNNENSTSKNGINPNQIISLAPEEEIGENTESASSSIGNKVNENQTVNNTSNSVSSNATNTNNATNTTAKETAEKISQNKSNSQSDTSDVEKTSKNETVATSNKAESNEKVAFDWPVKGDILKAFSVDNLLYSSTLQEWTVHNGIDIKADKASVVCAAANGTVKSIKNDPRYGLTIIIEHASGYKTVYSNLLTTEFVVEGEKVSQGQSIGTVGNTANFEVTDDFHLHFEILKDDEYVEPMIYLK